MMPSSIDKTEKDMSTHSPRGCKHCLRFDRVFATLCMSRRTKGLCNLWVGCQLLLDKILIHMCK